MKEDRERLPALCKLPGDDEHEAPERKRSRLSKDANRLTVRKIETKLKEPGRYSLYLQITPAGSRSWLLRYARDGRERMLGLGPLHTIGLKDAREKARKARAQLLDGIDPLQERRGRRTRLQLEAAQAVTFREASMRFLKTHEGAWTNAVHRPPAHSPRYIRGAERASKGKRSNARRVRNKRRTEISNIAARRGRRRTQTRHKRDRRQAKGMAAQPRV